ncbi:MAG: hypothetical protein GC178_08540 [Flavobacteriales bacterium]|nr:hypothetical protein [Flavobacteriales bacterium]
MPEEEPKISKYSWIFQWIFWSTLMILFMGVGEPLYHNKPITASSLLHEAILWIPAGLVFALVNYFFNKRKEKKNGQ